MIVHTAAALDHPCCALPCALCNRTSRQHSEQLPRSNERASAPLQALHGIEPDAAKSDGAHLSVEQLRQQLAAVEALEVRRPRQSKLRCYAEIFLPFPISPPFDSSPAGV